MAEDWASIAAEVSKALGSVGFMATLRRPSVRMANPWDAQNALAGEEIEVTIVQDTYSVQHTDGSLIQAGDRRILMNSAAAPTVADRLIIDGETFAIVNVSPTAPGGEAVMYEVQARR